MTLGETPEIPALDDHGQPLTGLTRSSSDTSIVPVLTLVAANQADNAGALCL